MSTSTAEVGRVDGEALLHAVRPGISGPSAVCGAGRITGRVPGRFDPGGDGVCPACAAQATGRG